MVTLKTLSALFARHDYMSLLGNQFHLPRVKCIEYGCAGRSRRFRLYYVGGLIVLFGGYL